MDQAKIQEEARTLFAVFDQDKSGILDRKEIKRLLEHFATQTALASKTTVKEITQEDVDNFTLDYDVNDDGRVNKGEFIAMYTFLAEKTQKAKGETGEEEN